MRLLPTARRPLGSRLGIATQPEPHSPRAPFSPGVPGDVRFGVGSFNRQGYHGPRPSAPDNGPHKYLLQVIALEKSLSNSRKPPTLDAVLAAANGKCFWRGARIVGQFER